MPVEVVRHGIASFPGVQQVVDCWYTCEHGVEPGIAVLSMLPQDTSPGLYGDLIFSDGVLAISLRACKVDYSAFHLTTSKTGGTLWHLKIMDRRWAWIFGSISGVYNQYNANGILLEFTKKEVGSLAELCLIAMGETNYVITGLPSGVYPSIDWDHENPAQALKSLVNGFDCRVIFRVDSDSVLIAPKGVGNDLPVGHHPVLVPPVYYQHNRPDWIMLVGDPIRYQALMILEAVGLDFDGKIYTLDNLSYAPAGTTNKWDASGPPNWANVTIPAGRTIDEVRELAGRCVWKWYRVKMTDTLFQLFNLSIPGFGEILRREQLILESAQVARTADNSANLPAEVYGVFWAARGGGLFANTAAAERLAAPFIIDPHTFMVRFEEHVFKILPAGAGFREADLRLLTAVQIREETKLNVKKYEQSFTFPGQLLGTGPRIIIRPDVQFEYLTTFVASGAGYTPGLTTDNTITVEAAAAYYLTATAQEYQVVQSLYARYNGLMPIWLDGAVQQVTWKIGLTTGAITEASRNSENSLQSSQSVMRRVGADHMQNEMRTPPGRARGVDVIREAQQADRLARGRPLLPELPALDAPIID